jgi:hypothetical protein
VGAPWVAAAAAATAAPLSATREEASVERVELRDTVLGNLDGDLLVLRCGLGGHVPALLSLLTRKIIYK